MNDGDMENVFFQRQTEKTRNKNKNAKKYAKNERMNVV